MARRARIIAAVGCITAAAILSGWAVLSRSDYWTPPNSRLLHDDGFAKYYSVPGESGAALEGWLRRRIPRPDSDASLIAGILIYHDREDSQAFIRLTGRSLTAHDGFVVNPGSGYSVEVHKKPFSWPGAIERLKSMLP